MILFSKRGLIYLLENFDLDYDWLWYIWLISKSFNWNSVNSFSLRVTDDVYNFMEFDESATEKFGQRKADSVVENKYSFV